MTDYGIIAFDRGTADDNEGEILEVEVVRLDGSEGPEAIHLAEDDKVEALTEPETRTEQASIQTIGVAYVGSPYQDETIEVVEVGYNAANGEWWTHNRGEIEPQLADNDDYEDDETETA